MDDEFKHALSQWRADWARDCISAAAMTFFVAGVGLVLMGAV